MKSRQGAVWSLTANALWRLLSCDIYLVAACAFYGQSPLCVS